MKKLILITTFLAAGAVGLMAQGLVKFTNDPAEYPDSVDRLFYQSPGVPISSDQWSATLQENVGGTWRSVGAAVNFYGDFGGAFPEYAGIWPDDSNLRVLSVPPQTQTSLRVAVDDGAGNIVYTPAFDYTQAISVPPSPNDFLMVNLTAFTVPEPSTIALGVLGLGALLLFRRRKN